MIVEEEAYLEHFGKKGMKWGVRNQKQLDRARRLSKGKGTLSDKLLMKESAFSLIRGGGVKGASANTVKKLEARKKRIKAGKATTKDLLNRIGGEPFTLGGTK